MAPKLPPLRTDEGKVSQILRNLISNALKFTPNGKVTVSARMVESRDVQFTVEDTGIGIAGEHHETIFREFSQVENPLQERYRGTGLGLPLCRNLAMLLGGRIWLESELGKGSTFFVRIPAVYVGEAITGGRIGCASCAGVSSCAYLVARRRCRNRSPIRIVFAQFGVSADSRFERGAGRGLDRPSSPRRGCGRCLYRRRSIVGLHRSPSRSTARVAADCNECA